VATFLTEFAEIARQDERLHHLSITVVCDADLQGSFDPALLQQVLWNLALNACGAIAGSGEIRFSARHATNNDGHGGGVVVDVADTGSGIAEEHLPHLFEPFYTTKVGGTGLGLATVYRIIEAHHGRIDVSRNQGMTTFSFWLPIVAESKE
jgi:two-component system sensor histidine kinase PilS (NtrC family)